MSDDTVHMVLDSAVYSISNTYSQSSGRYTVNYKDAKLSRQFGADMPLGILTLQVVTKRDTSAWAPVGETRLIIVKAAGTGTVAIADWAYGDEPNAPVSINGTETVNYDYKVQNADDETYDAAVPTDVGNYTVRAAFAESDKYLAHSDTANFEITARPITITGIAAANKEYDGNDTAAIIGTATVSGVIDGDDVTVIYGTASFADKDTGTGKLVTFSGFSLGGADAGKYVLSEQPASVTADIIEVSPILPQIAEGNRITPTRNGINLATKTGVTIAVYNLSGKLISKQSYHAGNHSISLNRLPKGIYLIQARFAAQKTETILLTIR
jgi:hypothetical protein